MKEKLLKLIEEYDQVGIELNSVKAELRFDEFEFKTKKLNLEFDEEFTNGLKVKEIPHKIHNELLEEQREICELKTIRDNLEHKFKMLGLQIQYTKDVIEALKS